MPDYDVIEEDVPPFEKRLGDTVFQGSNGTLIVLGTDRAKKGPAKRGDGLGHVKAEGQGKGTASVHVVAGRAGPDPDFEADKAFLYVTAKTKIDDNLGLASVETATNDKSSVIAKADTVRLVARENVKISMDGGKQWVFIDKKKITVKIGEHMIEMDDKTAHIKIGSTFVKVGEGKIVLDAGTIELGSGAGEKVILGDSFKSYFETHTHPSAVGPTGPPIQPFLPTLLSQRVVKVK